MLIRATTFNLGRKRISASKAPTPGEGSVERIVMGWTKLSTEPQHDIHGDESGLNQQWLIRQ